MIDYIKSILPRIQRFSKQLNDEANFVDIPWGFLDGDGHKVTYIFRQSGELLVSKQGEVVTGHWEYLPVMQSMLIEHEGRKRMFNQGFLDKAVMILRKDGTEELFPLANVSVIQDLDITKYLENIVPSVSLISHGILEKEIRPKVKRTIKGSGKEIFIWGEVDLPFVDLNKKTFATYVESNTPLKTGEYEITEVGKLIVEDGIVKKIEFQDPDKFASWVLGFTAVIVFVFIIFLILTNI